MLSVYWLKPGIRVLITPLRGQKCLLQEIYRFESQSQRNLLRTNFGQTCSPTKSSCLKGKHTTNMKVYFKRLILSTFVYGT